MGKLALFIILSTLMAFAGEESNLSKLTGMSRIQILNEPVAALGLCSKSGKSKASCKDLIKEEFNKLKFGSYKFCRLTGRSEDKCHIYKENLKSIKKPAQVYKNCFMKIKGLVRDKAFHPDTKVPKYMVEEFMEMGCFEV